MILFVSYSSGRLQHILFDVPSIAVIGSWPTKHIRPLHFPQKLFNLADYLASWSSKLPWISNGEGVFYSSTIHFQRGVFYGLHEVITSQWAFINRLASSYVALPNPFPFQWKLAHTASTKFMFSHLRTTVTKGTLLYDVRTCWWWWWSWHWCRWARWLWWGRWRRGGCILFYVITDSLIYNRILCKNCWTLQSCTTSNQCVQYQE